VFEWLVKGCPSHFKADPKLYGQAQSPRKHLIDGCLVRLHKGGPEVLHRDAWKHCDLNGWHLIALGGRVRLEKPYYVLHWGPFTGERLVYTVRKDDYKTVDEWLAHMTRHRRPGYLNEKLHPEQLPWEIALISDLTAQRAAAEAYWASHV